MILLLFGDVLGPRRSYKKRVLQKREWSVLMGFLFINDDLGPVVQSLDKFIQRINPYRAELSTRQFYPLDRDLFAG